jgi:YidC/Oxa1 family membrane protein insertase
LQERHRRDPVRLGTELVALYRSAGTSPVAGFLPLLVQAPFFMVWYRIFTASQVAGQANALLAHPFLGAALSAHLFGHPLAFVPLLLVLFILGVVSVRRTRHVATVGGAPAPGGVIALLPFASLLSAFVMPLAAVVYLCTTLTWTAVENVVLRRGLPAH